MVVSSRTGFNLLVDTTRLTSIKELFERNSLLHGEFTLSSGLKSKYYIDCKKTTLDPQGAYLIGREIFELIRGMYVDAIGGLSIGADPIATAVAIASYEMGKPIPAFIVRDQKKEHGTGEWIGGPPLRNGSRVVIVDDVVTTAVSIFKAIEAVEAAGCKVVKVVALVDRHGGGSDRLKRLGYDFAALLHASPAGNLTFEPA